MSRVNKTKVLIGGAMKRKSPSKASEIICELKLLSNDVLDYGCGYGFDADYYGWEKYDPYYFDNEKILTGKFKNIVCINVLNVVSKKIRNEIITNIQDLLTEDGKAYLVAPRNIPVNGKYSGYHRRPQNYVVLTLLSVYKSSKFEIYQLNKYDIYDDLTINIGEVN